MIHLFVSLARQRRMKDSNLQVVSDRPASNRFQYHYGNTAGTSQYTAIYQEAHVFIRGRSPQGYSWEIGGVGFEPTQSLERSIYSQIALSTNAGGAFLLNCHLP